VHDLLHLVQNLFTMLFIEFRCLPLEEFVEIGIAAIGIGAPLHGKHLEPHRRIVERATATLDQVLEFLLGVTLDNSVT